jgi:Flp pilus assembly protein TadG
MKSVLLRCTGGISSHLARFRGDRSGNVAILFALSLVVLMLGIGAAVDIGRWLHARDKTIAAIDAAVLAGARTLQLDDADVDTAVATATKYYDENVSQRLPVTDDTVTFTVSDSGNSVTANGSAYIETPFLRFANIEKLPLVTVSKAEAEYGTVENLEISLMLDVTGSMKGDKLADLKTAAKDLIEIIESQVGKGYTTKVALVPFSEDIRLPTTSALNKARGNNLPDEKEVRTGSGWNQQTKTYYLSDCVVERKGAQKYTDAEPSAADEKVMAHYTEDYTQSGGGGGNGWGWGGGWGSGGKKKGKCTVPENSAIVPLSDDTEELKEKIDDLSADGYTAGHLGTAWAWYTLSPNWASLWPAKSRPEPYETEDLKKIAILMTDGEYNTQYDKDGISVDRNQYPNCSDAVNGCSATQARALCTAMKDKGIIVYAIGFELAGSWSESYKTLEQCAANPEDDKRFYNAKNGEQLKQAFRDIGLKLSKLYLSK